MQRVQNIDQVGINLIKKWESFRSKPYLCPSGIPTIGYGTTYYPNGKRVRLTDSAITEQEATNYLYQNVKFYESSVDSFTRDDITQNQFNALVSFAYNVGVENFRRSTLLKLVNHNPVDPNISKQFLRWNRSEGKVLRGLTLRRKEESILYQMI